MYNTNKISVLISVNFEKSCLSSCIYFSAQFLVTMVNLEGEETFDASYLGSAEEVVQERICDDELILIKG